MKGGELDRNARILATVGRVAGGGEGGDRPSVGEMITLGIGLGARRFAEHVIRKSETIGLALLCALHRFLDIAPEHELPAELAHGAFDRGADDRLAEAADGSAQRTGQALLLLVVQHLAGDHQRPGRGID